MKYRLSLFITLIPRVCAKKQKSPAGNSDNHYARHVPGGDHFLLVPLQDHLESAGSRVFFTDYDTFREIRQPLSVKTRCAVICVEVFDR